MFLFPCFLPQCMLDPSPTIHPEQESAEHIHEWTALSSIQGTLTGPVSGHKSLLLISRLLGLKAELPADPQTLTFADEALLGDGLLAYIAALGLLEWLQLEGVCVDALQLVGLREEEEGREIRRVVWIDASGSTANGNTFGIQQWYIRLWLRMGVWSPWWHLVSVDRFTCVFVILSVFLYFFALS